MSLLEIIKQASVAAVMASNPVTVQYGTVVTTAPLSVQIDQKITLPSRFLVLTETVQSRGLQEGDSLLLLRVQGGQSYVILDRVVGTS